MRTNEKEARLKERNALAGEKWKEAEWKGGSVELERFRSVAAANRADLESLRAAWKSALRNPFRDLLRGLTQFRCLGVSLALCVCVCVYVLVCACVLFVCREEIKEVQSRKADLGFGFM